MQVAAVFTDRTRLDLQLSSQFLAAKTAEYKAYTAAQLAWIRQERKQLEFSASCMAPCIVMPASAVVQPDQLSPVVTLDLGKLVVSTTHLDSQSGTEVAYETNSIQVSGVELRLSRSNGDWSRGEFKSITHCDLALELQRCLVQHLVLPESRLKLRCVDGIRAELSPSDFSSIMKVANCLIGTDRPPAISAHHTSTTPAISDTLLDDSRSTHYISDSDGVLGAPAEEADSTDEDAIIVMPNRASVEITLECGPLMLALSDQDKLPLVQVEMSSVMCQSVVYPYHITAEIQTGHLVIDDQFVRTHADADVERFGKLFDSNEQSFKCTVTLNSRQAAAAALEDRPSLRRLNPEQLALVQQISEGADTSLMLVVKGIDINWNWQTIRAVMNAYVHHNPSFQSKSIQCNEGVEDLESAAAAAISIAREKLFDPVELGALDSKDLAQLTQLQAQVELGMLRAPREDRIALVLKQKVIHSAIAEYTKSIDKAASVIKIEFKIESVSLNLNNEAKGEQLLQCSMTTLDAAVRFGPAGTFGFSVSLGNLEVIDKHTVETQHPAVLGLCDSEAPSLLNLSFESFSKSESGYTSKLSGHLYAMQIVLVRSVLEPILEYGNEMILAPLVGQKVCAIEDSTQAKSATAAPPCLQTQIDLKIDAPHILVPVDASALDRFELLPGSITVKTVDSSSIVVQFDATSLKAYHGTAQTTLFSFDMELGVVQTPRVDDRPAKIAVSAKCSEIQLLVEKEMCGLVRDVIQYNLLHTSATAALQTHLQSPSISFSQEVVDFEQTTFEAQLWLPNLGVQLTAEHEQISLIQFSSINIRLSNSSNETSVQLNSEKLIVIDQLQPIDSDFGQLVRGSDVSISGTDCPSQCLDVSFRSTPIETSITVALQDIFVEWNHKTVSSVMCLLMQEATQFQTLLADTAAVSVQEPGSTNS